MTGLVDQWLLEVTPGVGTVVACLPEASTRDRSALLNQKADALVVEAKRVAHAFDKHNASLSEGGALAPVVGALPG